MIGASSVQFFGYTANNYAVGAIAGGFGTLQSISDRDNYYSTLSPESIEAAWDDSKTDEEDNYAGILVGVTYPIKDIHVAIYLMGGSRITYYEYRDPTYILDKSGEYWVEAGSSSILGLGGSILYPVSTSIELIAGGSIGVYSISVGLSWYISLQLE